MGWRAWFGLGPPLLEASLRERVTRWAKLPAPKLNIPLDDARLIVVDVETTGMDPARDALLSIGAVRLQGRALDLGESFHGLVLPDRQSTRENILVHGIAPSQQAQGEPADEILVRFLEYCGADPLMAFHAPFDRSFLSRAARRGLGIRLRNPFIDMAWVLPALFPHALPSRSGLDDWARHFNLQISRRHAADADALATGELLLVALAEARRQSIATLQQLMTLASRTAKLAPPGPTGGA